MYIKCALVRMTHFLSKVDLLTFVDVRSSKVKTEEQFKYEVRINQPMCVCNHGDDL